jgi:hypothetical protein
MINVFPFGQYAADKSEDFNPSIRMFGRRFSNDQHILDLLAEFLLVVESPKNAGEPFGEGLPDRELLNKWSSTQSELVYHPRALINLKLFSFLSASRLESRHTAHRQHGNDLWRLLREKVDLEGEAEKNEFLKTLSLLFLGFWGNGAQRTWCAQTFYPFCSGVLGGDIIWNETTARQKVVTTWDEILTHFSTYFDANKHRFLARGGEALYLQVCNGLLRTQEEIDAWLRSHVVGDTPLGFTARERSPAALHAELQKDFGAFFGLAPKMLGEVMGFVDREVDPETAQRSDWDGGKRRAVRCGWIPQESWREGYLFAIELHRILSANIGIMETVEMLQIACALQVMRSLAAQSYRHSLTPGGAPDGFDYRILICDNASRNQKMKRFSSRSQAEIVREIQQAIRIPEILDNVVASCSSTEKEVDRIYSEADSYGFKLYRKIGKSIGLIVPPTGGKMRYTLNDKLLKYLVVAMIPEARITLDSFKKQVELHHGFVFDLQGLQASRNWREHAGEIASRDGSEAYLEGMLEASGVLVRLSDSCSLVKNPYVGQQD